MTVAGLLDALDFRPLSLEVVVEDVDGRWWSVVSVRDDHSIGATAIVLSCVPPKRPAA